MRHDVAFLTSLEGVEVVEKGLWRKRWADFEEIRMELGWTKGFTARKLGVHRNTVTRWTLHGSPPTIAVEFMRVWRKLWFLVG